ncbi:hypothetical protein [Faecalibacterium sp. IP-3-29]|uniref:hypothetical protein n=1 Tax=Faecalibacterium sp. IP-3-29 TaxID=2929489 RepID=UPI002014F3D1|nr:hypothetical protein [Faecalibacterium sp. IP-3-29]UQK51741.1 hypothetical protein MTP40_02970 [Faecalibacterium sp. IP-3-29]
MKKMATIVLGLMLVLTLVGCGNNAQSSDAHNAEYEEGYAAGYEAGYNDGKQQIAESKSILHSFRVLLWPQLSNSCPITMRFREKQSPLFTSFKTGLFASFPEGLDRRTY